MCCPEIVRSIQQEASASGSPSAEVSCEASADEASRRPPMPLVPRRVVDLTHTLTPDFPIFPAYRPVEITPLFAVERNGFAAAEVRFAEHTGTHLDAPAHFVQGGMTADLIPADRLVAPLVVVSIAERAARDDDAQLTVDDLHAWERRHGAIPPGAVVAMHSGWESRLGQRGRFLNSDELGIMHSPGFSVEAARFLVEERDITGAATDTLSLDVGASATYDAHRVFLPAGRYGLENVARLGEVPPAGAMLIVGGPKHLGATGGPARLLALF